MQTANTVSSQLPPEFYKRLEAKCLGKPLIKKLDERIATLLTGLSYDEKEIKEGEETLNRLNRYLTCIEYRSDKEIAETIIKRTDTRSWVEKRKVHRGELLDSVKITAKTDKGILSWQS